MTLGGVLLSNSPAAEERPPGTGDYADPVLAMVAEYRRLQTEINAAPAGDDGTIDNHPNWPLLEALEVHFGEQSPTTLAGALAVLDLVHSLDGINEWTETAVDLALTAIRKGLPPPKPERTDHLPARAVLELDGGTLMPLKTILSADDKQLEAWVAQAVAAVRRDLKDALNGLLPIFGEEALLSFCRSIIDEDRHPNRPQTVGSRQYGQAL